MLQRLILARVFELGLSAHLLQADWRLWCYRQFLRQGQVKLLVLNFHLSAVPEPEWQGRLVLPLQLLMLC